MNPTARHEPREKTVTRRRLPPAAVLLGLSVILLSRPEGVGGVEVTLLLALAVALTWLRLGRSAHLHILALVFLAWLFCTAIWSQFALTTVAAAAQSTVIITSSAVVAAALPLTAALRVMSVSFKTLLVVSMIVAIVQPGIGLTSRVVNHGALEGIYPHRNVFGFVVALAFVVFLYAEEKLLKRLFWCLVAVVAVAWTGSGSSILIMAVSLAIFAILRVSTRSRHRKHHLLILLGAIVSMLAAIAFAVFWNEILAALGRDTTFTGRTAVWDGGLAAISERPVGGWGWGTIFSEGSVPGEVIRAYGGWELTSVHSSYLSLAVQAGWIGLAVGVALVLASLMSTLRSYLNTGSRELACLLQLVIIVTIVGAIENRSFVDLGLFLTTYALASAGYGRSNEGSLQRG